MKSEAAVAILAQIVVRCPGVFFLILQCLLRSNLSKRSKSWQNGLHIGYLSCSHVRGSGRQPAMSVLLEYLGRYSPVLATAVPGACICVCVWCSKALHLLVCVQGVITTPCVPAQPAQCPWCASEGSQCGRSCLRHFC